VAVSFNSRTFGRPRRTTTTKDSGPVTVTRSQTRLELHVTRTANVCHLSDISGCIRHQRAMCPTLIRHASHTTVFVVLVTAQAHYHHHPALQQYASRAGRFQLPQKICTRPP
jgi:hypothetical protein